MNTIQTPSSKPISLTGVSDRFAEIPEGVSTDPIIKSDAEIVAMLEEQAESQLEEKRTNEIFDLMINNQQRTQYKAAMDKTIASIKSGSHYRQPEQSRGGNVNG